MTPTHPTLFSGTDAYGEPILRPRRLSIDARFDRLMLTDNGRAIYAAFVGRARVLVMRGARRLSAGDICDHLRERSDQRMDGPWKINEHFTALFGRKAMAEHADLAGMFETRKRKVEGKQ